jgi:hypothetical protein
VFSFFLVSATGRIAVILIGLDILLPYILRRTRLSRALGIAQDHSSSYLHRMWPHYLCGYSLILFSVVHAWISMQAGSIRPMNMSGVLFATIGIALMLLQIAIGLFLQDRSVQKRKLIRRWHYWIMLALVGAVAVHIWLNG